MDNILNITNGDCAVKIMQEAEIAGVFLPWRDVLHDGPVPKGLSLEELSKVRADFIASRGWGDLEDINRDFIQRDNTLKSFENYEKIILWFEHDLYDQLQIIQILDWFNTNKNQNTQLSIICTDKYLGMLSADEMKGMPKYEEKITEQHLSLSSKAWLAFTSSTPELWFELLNTDTTALPFLDGAVLRLLEEYPDSVTGLSRTAKQALLIISKGQKLAGAAFGSNQGMEERIFLGNSSFWVILQALLHSSPALLALPPGQKLTLPTRANQELTVTPEGLDVLAGKKDWLNMIEIDHWIGGTHLKPANTWRWNSNTQTIINN